MKNMLGLLLSTDNFTQQINFPFENKSKQRRARDQYYIENTLYYLKRQDIFEKAQKLPTVDPAIKTTQHTYPLTLAKFIVERVLGGILANHS